MSHPSNSGIAQERRRYLEGLTSTWAKGVGVDHKALILLAMDVERQCDTGIISEKVCMGADGGKVELIERFPAVRIQALAFIHKVLEGAQKELDKLPPSDPEIHIHMSRRRLEDVLALAEDL